MRAGSRRLIVHRHRHRACRSGRRARRATMLFHITQASRERVRRRPGYASARGHLVGARVTTIFHRHVSAPVFTTMLADDGLSRHGVELPRRLMRPYTHSHMKMVVFLPFDDNVIRRSSDAMPLCVTMRRTMMMPWAIFAAVLYFFC